jgi:hypothetical protein
MHAWCAQLGLAHDSIPPLRIMCNSLHSIGGCCPSSTKLHVLHKSPSDACQAPFFFLTNDDSRTYLLDISHSRVTLFSNARALWQEAKTFDRRPTICGFVHSRRYFVYLLSFLAQLVCPQADSHYTAFHCCIEHNTSHIPVYSNNNMNDDINGVH